MLLEFAPSAVSVVTLLDLWRVWLCSCSWVRACLCGCECVCVRVWVCAVCKCAGVRVGVCVGDEWVCVRTQVLTMSPVCIQLYGAVGRYLVI